MSLDEGSNSRQVGEYGPQLQPEGFCSFLYSFCGQNSTIREFALCCIVFTVVCGVETRRRDAIGNSEAGGLLE